MELPLLPTINAVLNGSAAVLLFLGWRAIKSGRRDTHRNIMIAALTVSALFLACYLYYHYQVGSVRYQGQGIARTLYFAILLTHTPLAGLMTPFILASVWFAYKQRFDIHTKLTKWVWPVWMYVSVTGVIIYLMLYILPQPA
ncbi:MAG: DUF420 domain-containing protein [Candidatus Hydrogenedentes bacterium]|nr:DUF420 domain-containing protein [Candidatus Hydrogenedentota bacterium]